MLSEEGMDVLPPELGSEGALEALRAHHPDLVLLDLGLPGEGGLALGRRILEERPDVKLLAVTALKEATAVREAVRAGFGGYLTKDLPRDRFLRAVRTAMDGEVVVPAELAPSAAGARTSEERQATLLADQLTSRERGVLALLVEGLSGADIAKRLSVSSNTVRTHIHNILTKLGVHSRLEAAAFAIRCGIVRVGTGADRGESPGFIHSA